jgi:Ser/Thr protein kinase RdoA (MazF antagonist)
MQAPDPYSAAIHALLRHLETVGFRGAPRSFGWDAQGRHLVEWVDGIRADDPAAPDAALDPARIGAFMREMHDALASFEPPAGVEWFQGLPGPGAEMIIHQDISPSNIVVTPEGRLVAIDWDAAAPGTRLWDLAHAAHAFAPLARGGLDPESAAERLARFADGYGLTDAQRAELLPLLAARSESMYEYLDAMRITGESPWIDLWERGVGTVWKSDAQWIRENEPHWRGALLVA